uniref:Putative secreted protein n=1 Tax=Ixodes ricinus TaxID=34613 RepID=A0A6B0UCP5_IXORI
MSSSSSSSSFVPSSSKSSLLLLVFCAPPPRRAWQVRDLRRSAVSSALSASSNWPSTTSASMATDDFDGLTPNTDEKRSSTAAQPDLAEK